MRPAGLLEQAEDERGRPVLYAGEGDGDELREFGTRNATVVRRRLPAGDDERTRGLLARERDDGRYSGFWNSDPERVTDMAAAVRALGT